MAAVFFFRRFEDFVEGFFLFPTARPVRAVKLLAASAISSSFVIVGDDAFFLAVFLADAVNRAKMFEKKSVSYNRHKEEEDKKKQ